MYREEQSGYGDETNVKEEKIGKEKEGAKGEKKYTDELITGIGHGITQEF